jgi:hypothetical protein
MTDLKYRNITLALVAICTSIFGDVCLANAVQELSLESKVKRSDIVFIGRVASVSTSVCFKEHYCADVEIQTLLKGKKTQTLRVLWGGPITEFDPACCEVDKNYLFFLKRRKGIFFETVNAYHGVYELPESGKKVHVK